MEASKGGPRSHIQDILSLIDRVLPEPTEATTPSNDGLPDRSTRARPRAPARGPTSHSLADLEAYLGNKMDRPIANNTRVRRTADGVQIVFHETVIMEFQRGCLGAQYMTLNSGGWTTDSTFRRINDYLPPGFTLIRFNRRRENERLIWTWFLGTPGGRKPYADGMTVPVEWRR